MKLAEHIGQTEVATGEIAVFYLAQAGFALKTSTGRVVYMDPYLSDCCERMFGFKRMIPAVIKAEEIQADVLASTHAHADHLDPDALPVIAKNDKTFFIGAPDCEETYQSEGLKRDRYEILSDGESCQASGIEFRAVYADHGDLAPEAVGLVMTVDGITIYNTGDTAYAPDRIRESLKSDVDIMIAPINGAFGNLDAMQACQLANVVKPCLLIASHFGMFVEHGGDPAAFLKIASDLCQGIQPVVMAPGEKLVYSKVCGVVSSETLKVTDQ